MTSPKILALTGGVGGAKLAVGLSKALPPEDLLIVANTGDDFEHIGITICPDLDSVMYALADVNDTERGWGIRGESWHCMDALEQLKGETWFRLGDKDLATHIQRSELLSKGRSLTDATAALCNALNISHALIPMTDSSVATQVLTADGLLAFQHYFVRDQCEPQVSGFTFNGIESAEPNPLLMKALESDCLEAIVICPSNPFVSVDPILKLPRVLEAILKSSAKVVAVSPIVSGMALKGPAAKMMAELKMPASANSVANYYCERYPNLLDGFVIDQTDVEQLSSLPVPGIAIDTVMKNTAIQLSVAEQTLAFARSLHHD